MVSLNFKQFSLVSVQSFVYKHWFFVYAQLDVKTIPF